MTKQINVRRCFLLYLADTLDLMAGTQQSGLTLEMWRESTRCRTWSATARKNTSKSAPTILTHTTLDVKKKANGEQGSFASLILIDLTLKVKMIIFSE